MDLSDQEKGAIRESWKLMTADLQGQGVNFIVNFLKEYPDDKDKFPAFKGKDPESLRGDAKMIWQAKVVMDQLGSIVDSLDNQGALMEILKKNAHNHFDRQVREKQYKDIFGSYVKYLGDTFGDKCNDQTKAAWNKALNAATAVIVGEMNTMG